MTPKTLLVTFGIATLACVPVGNGQCPQICDTTNTALGNYTLQYLTSGISNVAIGGFALYQNSTGDFNTSMGVLSSYWCTTGSNNTADGFSSLFYNNGNDNTAVGYNALLNNWADDNTAIGSGALEFNQGGYGNTATGFKALYSSNNGADNVADGVNALLSNTGGNFNTAIGANVLVTNTTGSDNTATGVLALAVNSTGGANTAEGEGALLNNTTGASNTADGFYALSLATTGNSNIAVGDRAGSNLTTGSNNIDIGNSGAAAESSRIRIGTKGTHRAAFIAGISGVPVTGVGVVVSQAGQLGITSSSARFKENIKPMEEGSEALYSLQPVTFRYKKDLDPERIPQFGLIAEQVENTAPELVVRDEENKPYTVRYEAVNAMLLNEFLKEHRTVQEQSREIAQLKSELAEQRKAFDTRAAQEDKSIAALTAQVQQVSTASTTTASTVRVVTKQ